MTATGDPGSATGTTAATQTSIPSGIANRPPDHLLIAAFGFAGDGQPSTNIATIEGLQNLIQHELSSEPRETTPASDKNQPSAETGELGFDDGYDRAFLTITFGVSTSGLTALGVAPANQPADLIAMPWDKLTDTPQIADGGDVVLQICSDDPYVNEHVVRRVSTELAGRLTLRYALTGEQRPTSRAGRVSRSEGRALTGFLDGVSNLDPRGSTDDRALVFVDPAAVAAYPKPPVQQPGGGYGQPGLDFPPDLRPPPANEPPWTKNGTYMVVRASVIGMTNWDHQTLGAQETAIGRFKVSGAPLDLVDEPSQLNAEPNFKAHQDDHRVALNSHIRKANPRRDAEDASRRFFRRGYPFIDSTIGGLQLGLVFVCFARSISTQFEFVFRAWMRNPNFPSANAGPDLFLAFESGVLAGGYYFVPPLQDASRPWSWILPI